MAAIKLPGLRSEAYEHPSDAAALNVLKQTAGFKTFVEKFNAYSIERLLRVQLTGSFICVQPDSFPELHEILESTRARLDVSKEVQLYIGVGSEIKAVTVGVEQTFIVLTTAAAQLLSLEELAFVISHELGHIKSGHVLYYQIAEFLPSMAGIVGSFIPGFGEIFTAGIQAALLYWKRMSEFTADRAGLLGCQDIEVAWRTMTKFAGLPPKYYATLNTEDFLRQAREFKDLDADTLSKIAKWISAVGAEHPWTVVRAQQLLEWIECGKYEETLKNPRRISIQTPAGISGFCPYCGCPLRGKETFCPTCGHSLTPAPPVSGAATS